MPRLIHTVALAAAGVALAVGLWRGWGLWAAGRRMVLAYLAFFFLGALLALVVRLVPAFDRPQPAAEAAGPRRRRAKSSEKPAPGA